MITKKEGVCGGDACVEGTRIPVWTLVEFRKAGAEDAYLLEWVPTPDTGGFGCSVGLLQRSSDRD